MERDDWAIVRTVAENVRRVRKSRKISQEDLALEAVVDRTYVSQVERGKRNITVIVLVRLARALRTTVAALVTSPGRSRGIVPRQRKRRS
jgi:transcriptional regulator with XRE-family HTH domain